MNEFFVFLTNDFFPNLIKSINQFIESAFDLNLSYNQLLIIAILFLLIIFSFLVEIVKKLLPVVIVLFVIFYFTLFYFISFPEKRSTYNHT